MSADESGIGKMDCFVVETSEKQIKCRIDDTLPARLDGEKAELIVFLKVSEEAVCAQEVCEFTFTSKVPTVTSISTRFDEGSNTQEVILGGTGFTGQAEEAQFWVGSQV